MSMMLTYITRCVTLCMAVCTAVAVTGCGSSVYLQSTTDSQRIAKSVRSSASAVPFRFFSPSSIWNTPVSPDAPIDASSQGIIRAMTASITAEEQLQDGPWINTTSYSVPIYTVSATQPTVRVRLLDSTSEPALRSAWRAVPLPVDAQPSLGSDAQLVVWQPSRDRLWEFWRLAYEPDRGWHASWGGAIRHVSGNPGVYGRGAWPGAKPWWGASATSLPIVGGLITLEDFKLHKINHALAIAVPDTRAGVFASPARRSDGRSNSPESLPEGARLRLNPNLNLTKLKLPPVTLMIAEAAQRYGMIVRDTSKNVELFGQDPVSSSVNPFDGPSGYFEGKYPFQLLTSFPWQDLQLLKMELHHTDSGGSLE
jgi:hypothetical protein